MTLVEVIALVQERMAQAGPVVSEADVENSFILPILSELGWSGIPELRRQYAVDNPRGWLDFALMGPDGRPAAFVEAKKLNRDLSGDVMQVVQYAFSEGVGLCVLSNGAEWWLYLPMQRNAAFEDRRFAKLDLRTNTPDKVADVLSSCLEYDALTSGSGERWAQSLFEERQREKLSKPEIPKAWQRLLDGPNEMLVELVQEEVHEHTGYRPSKDAVVEFLKHGRAPSPPVQAPAQPPDLEGRRQMGGHVYRRSPSVPVRGFSLWGAYHHVGNQQQAVAMIADLMYERYRDNFERALRAPGVRRGGPGRLRVPHRISDTDYFIESGRSWRKKKERIKRLLEAFDEDPDQVLSYDIEE